MIFVLYKDNNFVNVDNIVDVESMEKEGWQKLTPAEIKAAGMEGFEQYISSQNTTVDANGKIIFTPLSKEELDIQLADKIRRERDGKLAVTDKYLIADFPIDADKLEAVKEYRKALRDVPKQKGFPRDVTWPVNPME